VEFPDDPQLEALLRGAAPEDVPAGFAERVVAASRARQRASRVARIWLASAAAVLVLSPAIALLLTARPVPREASRGAAVSVAERPEAESFAVQFPAAERSGQQVMMGQINGKLFLTARPSREDSDELADLPRLPMSMAGSVSPDEPGPSMAVRFD
jgi:hypothetical protein